MVQAFRRFVRSWPLLIALLISGCGDGEMDLSTSSGESDTGGNQAAAPDRDTFVQAKQAQIAGLKPTLNQTGEEVDILIVDFQAKLMYSESLGLQDLVASEQTPPRETSLPSQAVQSQAAREASPKILAQEADSAGEAFRRVPSVIGPFFQPLTVIDGSVKLPKASDLNWIDEGGDVAYNYLGLQYLHDPQSVITVDAGLISDSIAAHVRGKWYAFAAYTPVNGQYTAFSFRGWPVGGIAGETETRMRLEAVRDANPLLSGDQAGYFLRFFYGEGREALAVFEGIGVADLHGTGTAVRRVSTLLWASDDDDPRMCDVKWSNVRIGNEFGTRLFGPEDVNTTGPGEKLALVDGRVTDEIPYHEETVHLSCGKAVGMVIDTTGSMGGEIGAVKAALTAFIQSPAAEEVGTWTLSTFKDSASSFGLSSDSQVVKSWVSGLSASGGGDCPEESFGALRQAGEALEDVASPKSLILVTDASPRTGTVAAAKAHLLERDITLYVLLTGIAYRGFQRKAWEPM